MNPFPPNTDEYDAWERAENGAESEPIPGRGDRRSWAPLDLTTVLDGTYRAPRPSVGGRTDGIGLFYAGRVHTGAGESEALKTWWALSAMAVELHRGNAVMFVDFEDDPGAVVGRLLAIGAKPDAVRDRFAYIRPDDPVTAADNRTDLAVALADLQPTLVTLDGVTEAMALHGLELKDNTQIARFGKLLPRWIADRGPAVVALDHVVKDREGRGRYALGGVHKLNGVNGAAFVLENRQPAGIGLTAKSTVYISKDRPGQLRRHARPAGEGLAWFGDLVLESHDESFVEVGLYPPDAGTAPFRPTVLMGRVAEVLANAPDAMAKADIEARVRGKAVDIRTALAALVDDGYVTVEIGRFNAKLHRLIKPYGESA